MSVSKRLRYEILRRDNHACRYCGAEATEKPLQVDHVTPASLGGTDDPSNLATACADCNAGKSSSAPDSTLVDDVAQDAVRWRKAMERAAWEQRELATIREIEIEAFHDRWIRGWLPEDWFVSLGRFLDLGLSGPELEDLQRTTFAKSRQNFWNYFCGCAWTSLRQRQERAEEIIRTMDMRIEEL